MKKHKKTQLNRIFSLTLACLLMISSMNMSVFACEDIEDLAANSVLGNIEDLAANSFLETVEQSKATAFSNTSEPASFMNSSLNSNISSNIIGDSEDDDFDDENDDLDGGDYSLEEGEDLDDFLEDILENELADEENPEDDEEYEESYDEDDEATDYTGKGSSKGKLGNGIKLSGDVKNRIMQYVNSLNGHFTSPYKRDGVAVAKQCCAYVNQVWKNVFGVDLYSIPASSTSKYSLDGETAFEFFERVGLKTGDVIYTRYQKTKKNSKGNIVYDKNGNPAKTMGQHFVIVLDYDEDYIWYTDGYESRTRGFVISAKNKKVKFSESKYFKNPGGSYKNIEGAYYAKAGKKGTRFRYYSLPMSVWQKAGGDAANKSLINKTSNNMTSNNIAPNTDAELVIKGLEDLTFEYDGREQRPQVQVYHDGKLLEFGRDYAVKYENNVNAGTATVWARGIGKHRGTVSANFVINPLDISDFNGEINAKELVLRENGQLQKKKPLVSLTISENRISGNEIETDGGDIDRHNFSESKDNKIDENESAAKGISSNDIENIADNIDLDMASGVRDKINKNKKNTIRLIENESCIYNFPDEMEGAYLLPSDKPYVIEIEGIGNFSGVLRVDEWIRERR